MARLSVVFAAILFGTTGTAHALGARRLHAPHGRRRPDPRRRRASRSARPRDRRFHGRWPLRLVVLSGIGVAIYQLAFFQAVADTGLAVGTIVATGSGPAFAGILERALDSRWPGRIRTRPTAPRRVGGDDDRARPASHRHPPLGAVVLDERLGLASALGAGLVLAELAVLAVPRSCSRAIPLGARP